MRVRSNITIMASFAYGPPYLSEEDIPGSSLNGRDPNRLKNSELQFWLKCRGDSCKRFNHQSTTLQAVCDICFASQFVVAKGP